MKVVQRILTTPVVLWMLWIGNATCLAAVNDPRANSSPRIACVISSQTNVGGDNKQLQIYNFPSTSMADTTDDGSSTATRHKSFQHKHNSFRPSSFFNKFGVVLQKTFLPTGWPNKTPVGYIQYSAWSWVQDTTTQLRSVLATQRILQGIGVGQQDATTLSALLNFILRDGCGMFATLVFTAVSASKFRTDVKRWRLFADIILDVGITLEVLATSVSKQFFLPMICIGNMCKAMCGVASGACGGAINVHWSSYKEGSIADIQAKFGAQHTVTASLGLLFAALFAKSVANVPTVQLWVLYAMLTLLHIYANARCMRIIAFNYLNILRLQFLTEDFFAAVARRSWKSALQTTTDSRSKDTLISLPSPVTVANQEPLLFLPRRRHPGRKHVPIKILFGVTFNEFVQRSNWTEADLQNAIRYDSSYVLATGRPHPKSKRLVIVVALTTSCSQLQQTKAYFHALLLKRRLGESPSDLDKMTLTERRDLEQQTQEELKEGAWKSFFTASTRAGWDLRKSEIQSQGYEIALQFRAR